MPDQDGFEPDPEGFTPDPPKSWYEDLYDNTFTVPNALRFGGSALGTVAGGLATGGIGAGAGMFAGGAAGEAAARWWEGKDFDPTITAVEGALNLLPGGGAIPGKGAALKTIGKYALRQSGHGAWQGAAGAFPRKLAEEGTLWEPDKWEAPSLRDIGTQTVAGGTIGGLTGGTLGAAASRFGKAKPSIAPPLDVSGGFEHPPIRPTHTGPAQDVSRPIGEGESILDYITGQEQKPTFQPLTNVPEGAEFLRNFASDPSAIPEAKAKASELLRRVTSGEIAPDEAERLFFADVDARTSRAGFKEVATPQPQAAFDPNSLTGLKRAEVEFVDPITGEVRSSADARPGDVLVPSEPKAAAPITPETPSTLAGWMEELVKGESGEFDPMELGRNIRASKFGQSVGKLASRFAKEDTGEVDLGRLQELFQKKQDGTITPEELAEAKAIAAEAKSSSAIAPVRTPHTPKVRTEVDIKGNTRVWIDDIEFTDRFGPGGPTMHDIRRLESQIKDPESWKRLAELKGEEYVGMAGPLPEQPKAPPKQITWSDTRKKKTAAATTTPAPTPEPTLPRAASLPAELAGAKPRFNIGADSYSPSFADDLDKALFIIAQKTRSKADAKYLQFVMEQTGMDEASARLAGQGVRTTIKNQLSNAEPGVVRIESIWRKNQQPAAASQQIPKVTAQEAGNGTVAKAANEKPAAVEATPEQAVATAMEAEQAATSLAERLKRATENPNPANSQYEIEGLLDEATEAINKIPEAQRAGWIRKVLGANKALLTAWDLSAPGRQGKAFIFNKAWWTSLDDMVKAWGSAKAADAVAQSIIDHPSGFFKKGVDKFGKPTPSFAERMGLDLAGVEELFTTNKGSAFEKYSGVGKSSRAHTAFLNKLRSDQFVAMMESAVKLGMDPQANLHQAQTYAKFINDATGRGSLNVGKWKLERNLGAINDVMFAPKNLSGQIRTWNAVLNPMKYASYDPVMRNQALRSLLAIAGSGLAVGELSRLMGGKVVDDPTSSDFRKIRVGDTRIDLFGGYQQFPVAAMKLLMNAETPTSGRDAGRTISFDKGGAFRNRATVAERFFTNRLSPAGSFVWAWMNNREFDGKPFEVKRALYERTAPIVLKDLYELAKDDPALAAIMTPSNTLGLTGTQTYGRN